MKRVVTLKRWVLTPSYGLPMPITWGEALPIGLLNMVDKQSLGAGYWRVLPDAYASSGLPDDVKFRLHWMALMHRAEVRVAAEQAERERAADAEYQAVLWRGLLN